MIKIESGIWTKIWMKTLGIFILLFVNVVLFWHILKGYCDFFSWIKRNWFVSEDEAHCTYIKVKGLVAMVNNLSQDASPLLGNHFLQLVYSKILDRNQNRIYVNPGLHKSRATFKFWTFLLCFCAMNFGDDFF